MSGVEDSCHLEEETTPDHLLFSRVGCTSKCSYVLIHTRQISFLYNVTMWTQIRVLFSIWCETSYIQNDKCGKKLDSKFMYSDTNRFLYYIYINTHMNRFFFSCSRCIFCWAKRVLGRGVFYTYELGYSSKLSISNALWVCVW